MEYRHKKTNQFLQQGLFDKINSFADLESRIEQLETKQMRGDAFEVFAQGYLATQKIVQAKSVWAFEDIPSKLMREIFIETPSDMGVDGVYQTVTDDRCAYQVKFRSGRVKLQWADLSTFMGLSEQADLRVLFTNGEKIPDLMDQRSKFYCIRGSDLDALKPDDFETIKTWLKAGRVKHKTHKPKPHQEVALREVNKVFEDADRATLVMACGTGKTLVALWVAEQSEAKNILILVPSLALVRQLLHEWLKHTTKWGNPSFMCVCSDPTVTRGDEIIVKQSELDFPVSTGSEDVSRYLRSRVEGPHIIFSTYQSAQVVADGMPDSFKFDLGFFDEAHKTAGREGTKFAFALTDDNVKIKKRLFMTATPRHYDVRKKDKEGDSKLVYSMDAPEVYGDIAYKLPFRQAVDEGLICDYKVLISVVTDAEINDWVLSHGEVVLKGDPVKARQVANQVALMNAISGHNISKIITFHSSVASAKSFVSSGGEGINSMVLDLVALHVNGKMAASKRSEVMRDFERSDFLTLISNARCMTEGVDVPAVDMVAFLSPKKSKVDIVQATGRAMRLSGNKKVGYVLLPLYLEQEAGESIDEAIERADFGEVWNVLQAMKEQDEELAEVIQKIQEERGKRGGYDDSRLTERVEVLGPTLKLATLRDAVVTQCVDRLGNNWDRVFGELMAYKEKHGDCNVPQRYVENQRLASWVNSQRRQQKKGILGRDRKRRLEEIGFIWDALDSVWWQRFDELVSYKKEKGHCNVTVGYLENPTLGTWVKVQRREFNSGNLAPDRITKLEELGLQWDPRVSLWEQRFTELVSYREEKGHCKVPQRYAKNRQLAQWARRQRSNYREGKIESERINRLEGIGFDWNPYDTAWEQHFKELVSYREKHGHFNVPRDYSENPKFGKWVSVQRGLCIKGKLEPDRFARLEDLGFVWDFRGAHWEQRFSELTAFKQKHGHCNVPIDYSENPQLGKWVSVQRGLCIKGKLGPDRFARLEDLGFVWDSLNSRWEKRFGDLVAYKKEHGDCNVPQSYAENLQLARWVSTQRVYYKKEKLELDRLRRLEQIGFEWSPKT